MIGYALLGTNDFEGAQQFYDGVLGTIGAKRIMEFPKSIVWGVAWDKPALGVCRPYDDAPATAGNGTMIALVVDERATVDALYARALELGGTDEGPPGLRGEEGPEAFYAAYFRDRDGNKLCVFRVGPAG